MKHFLENGADVTSHLEGLRAFTRDLISGQGSSCELVSQAACRNSRIYVRRNVFRAHVQQTSVTADYFSNWPSLTKCVTGSAEPAPRASASNFVVVLDCILVRWN